MTANERLLGTLEAEIHRLEQWRRHLNYQSVMSLNENDASDIADDLRVADNDLLVFGEARNIVARRIDEKQAAISVITSLLSETPETT